MQVVPTMMCIAFPQWWTVSSGLADLRSNGPVTWGGPLEAVVCFVDSAACDGRYSFVAARGEQRRSHVHLLTRSSRERLSEEEAETFYEPNFAPICRLQS